MPSQRSTENRSLPTVEVGGIGLEKITYKGALVVTFAQIDQVHLRPDGTAGRTFRENRARSTEGTDFIQIDQPDDIRRLGFSRPQGGVPASLTLITERGYRRLCKSLNDDKAWDVFDEMLDTYFGDDRPAAPAIPNFADPAVAARAWAEQYEGRVLAERKKAEIGSRREATAMSTARWAKDKAAKLEIELDRSNANSTVKRMEIAFGRKFPWHPLKKASMTLDLEIRTVPDPNFDTVKSYHARAWRLAYGVDVPGWTGAEGDA